MLVLGDLNEKSILLEEVGEAVNEMKSGKATGLERFFGGMFKVRRYGNVGMAS